MRLMNPRSAPAARPAQAGLIEVSTATQRDTDRVAFWADMVCQHLVPAECQSVLSPNSFHGVLALRQVGRVRVAQMEAGGLRVARTASLISQAGEEHFLISVQDSGRSELTQDSRVARFEPGGIAVCSSARPFRLHFEGDFARTVLTVPADELRRQLPNIDALTATNLDGGGAAGRLFVQMAHHCMGTDIGALPAEAAEHAAGALIELLASTLSCHRMEDSRTRPQMARFHLARIKQHARAHLHDPALSVASVSAAVRLSPSHVHRLFAGESQTFTAWLWSCRLLACKARLDDAAHDHLRVTDIAFSHGFNNSAHFSKSFRAKFGIAPRECRAARKDGLWMKL
jgi:AraC-like DNA-binding protein